MSNNEAFVYMGYYFMLIKEFKCKICGYVCQGYLEFEEHMEKHKKHASK